MAETAALPEEQDELLSSHNYDGIQEYDNPTPGWWNWLFIGSIVFTPIYIFWFHSPVVPRTLEGRYETAYAANVKLQFGQMEDYGSPRANVVHYMQDERWLAAGAAVFATNCKTCHGAEGQGISGPNMTDDSYINVKNIEDIVKVITDGAKNGAMPSWKSRLTEKEILVAAAYVASLRGKNVASTRPAEGNVIPPWPTVDEVGGDKPAASGDAKPEAAAETTEAKDTAGESGSSTEATPEPEQQPAATPDAAAA